MVDPQMRLFHLRTILVSDVIATGNFSICKRVFTPFFWAWEQCPLNHMVNPLMRLFLLSTILVSDVIVTGNFSF